MEDEEDGEVFLVHVLDDLWPHLEGGTRRVLRLLSGRVRSRADALVCKLELPSAKPGCEKAISKLLTKAGARWPRTKTLVIKGRQAEEAEEQVALVARHVASDTFPRLRSLEITLVSVHGHS